MLAQNFKSAEELYLNEKQYQALIKTLKMLETKKLKHIDLNDFEILSLSEEQVGLVFNMNRWNCTESCGTVCCIGGSAEIIGNLEKGELDSLSDKLHYDSKGELYQLFFPGGTNNKYVWSKITTEQAAQALRNYLTYSEPKWEEILTLIG